MYAKPLLSSLSDTSSCQLTVTIIIMDIIHWLHYGEGSANLNFQPSRTFLLKLTMLWTSKEFNWSQSIRNKQLGTHSTQVQAAPTGNFCIRLLALPDTHNPISWQTPIPSRPLHFVSSENNSSQQASVFLREDLLLKCWEAPSHWPQSMTIRALVHFRPGYSTCISWF